MSTIYQKARHGHWKDLFDKKNELLGSHNFKPGQTLICVISEILPDQVIKGENGRQDKINIAVLKTLDNQPVSQMALNITNMKALEKIYGPYYQEWYGKPIEIGVEKVRALQGGKVDALRIIPKAPCIDTKEQVIEKISKCEDLKSLQQLFTNIPPTFKKELKDAFAKRKAEIGGK